MAVFTAIAAVITGAITGAGFAAAFAAAGTLTGLGIATSLLAGGIAIATAKALGPSVPNIQSAKDPGVKIQLDPSTDNKLPIYYGQSFLGGIAIDAMIKNQNNTMVYAFAIGEQTDSGTVTIDDVYRGDSKLNFGSGASAHQVVSLTDPNGTSVTNVNGKIRCRVYAGNTHANAQIFPAPGGGTTAVDADTMFTNWSSDPNKLGSNAIISIVEVDYDASNGLQGLGTISYDFKNSLDNPANVLLDYLKNDRYGCGLTDDDLDLPSFTDMYDYANTQVAYTTSAGGSSTHSQWQINGGLSTFQPNLTNIDQICQNSATFFTYNAKEGKYKVVPNRAATTAELANAFVFNDDNITSSISVTEPDLYTTYNKADVEYSNGEAKDQTDNVFLEVPLDGGIPNFPSFNRIAAEPINTLSTRLFLTNDKARATNLGNLDLRQGRVGRTVEFEANHTALTVDVGDVVKITSPRHGFSEDLYRVMRVSEVDNGDGVITAKIVAMFYFADIYNHTDAQNEGEMGNSGIPSIPVVALPVPGVLDGTYGGLNVSNQLYGNIVVNEQMKTFGAGTQLTDTPGSANISSGTTFQDIVTESYDITNSDIGDYEIKSIATLGGAPTTAYDVGFSQNVTVTWANATNTASTTFTGGGVQFFNIPSTSPPPQLSGARKVSTDPVANGHPADMKPQTANITLTGYTDITESLPNFPRSFGGMNYEMLRVTKGEK
jgi:hypothetical protein